MCPASVRYGVHYVYPRVCRGVLVARSSPCGWTGNLSTQAKRGGASHARRRLGSATIRATEKRTVAPERLDPAGATVDSQHPSRGEAVLIVGAGREGVKRMDGKTITLDPIKAPVVAIARRVEIAIDASRDNWPGVRRLVATGDEQYDNLRTVRVVVDDDEEWARRSREGILRQAIRYGLIDRVLPTRTIVTVLVDDAGDYRRVEVTQHEERGAPIVAWLVDLVHDLWLDDARAAQGDQAPAGSGRTRKSLPEDDVEKMLRAVTGWPAAKAKGIRRRDYVQDFDISESQLTRWRQTLLETGHDVPDFT